LVEASVFWFVLHGANYLTVFHGYPRRIVAHFWSLAIEEQFYLVWPMIRFLKSRERMMILCGSLIAGAVLLRLILITGAGANPRQIYALTFTRIDALASGALLGLWLAAPGDQLQRRRLLAWLATICGSILALGLVRDGGATKSWSTMSQTLNYTAIAGLGACLIGWSRLSPGELWLNRALAWRPLPFFGKYSYSMYMFHIWLDAMGRAAGLHPGVNPALRSSGYWGSTFPMAIYFLIVLAGVSIWALITWHVLEKRFLALKDRFAYSPTNVPEALAQVAR
jgi:peptidoglycan/LPS O-acetylase OafA/YrhL